MFKSMQIPESIELKEAPCSVTVLLHNWKRAENLPRILDILCEQNFPKDKTEIIIVDNDSHDKVWDYARNYAKKYGDIAFRGFETHRDTTNPIIPWNIGGKRASKDVLIIGSTDVQMLGKNYLSYTSNYHALFGRIFICPVQVGMNEGEYDALITKDKGGSIGRAFFHELTGFDERIVGWGGCETDLYERVGNAGGHICCTPNLKVSHVQDNDEEAKKYGAPPQLGHLYGGMGTAPNKTWGEIDGLEEIKF